MYTDFITSDKEIVNVEQFPSSDLLLSNKFLKIPVDLAIMIGLPESIILGRLHYWIKLYETQYSELGRHKDHIHSGNMWVYLTFDQWHTQIPFYCIKTIKRAMKRLEEQNYILSSNFNKKKYDKTKWYRPNYKELEQLSESIIEVSLPSGQSVPMHKDNLTLPIPIDNYKNNNNNGLSTSSSLSAQTQSSSQKNLISCFNNDDHQEEINKTIFKSKDLKIFNNYIWYYESFLNKKHPFIKEDQIKRGGAVVKGFLDKMYIGIEELDLYIEEHFKDIKNGIFKSDGNFNHFATEGRLSVLSHRS